MVSTPYIPQKFTQRQFCWSRTHVRILSHSPQFRHTLTTCRRWRSHRRVSCPVRTLCEPATWPRRHHCNHSSSVPVESTSKTVPFPPPGTIQCVHFVQQFKINSTKTLPDYIPKTDDTTEIGREVVWPYTVSVQLHNFKQPDLSYSHFKQLLKIFYLASRTKAQFKSTI